MISKDVLQSFSDVGYLGVLYDTLRFDFDIEPQILSVQPLAGFSGNHAPVVGQAFTCLGTRINNEVDAKSVDRNRFEMLKDFTPGCIQVIDGSSCVTVAHFGNVSASLSREAGAVGTLILGNTRDVCNINSMEYPVFGYGLTPVDAFGNWAIYDWQKPIKFNSFTINPGDLIFMDYEGTIIVPESLIKDVYVSMVQRAISEAKVVAYIEAGKDVFKLVEEYERW